MTIEEKYKFLCETPSDIYEHLPTIKKYASECETIVELGVRYIVSTWALLAGHPKHLLSVDIEHPSAFGADIMEVYDLSDAEGTTFEFRHQSSLDITLPEHDLLFIDTLHEYDQLTKELDLHSGKCKKYILMHDTSLDGDTEMWRAVQDFLARDSNWKLRERFENNNGLTVLERV